MISAPRRRVVATSNWAPLKASSMPEKQCCGTVSVVDPDHRVPTPSPLHLRLERQVEII